MKSNFSYCEIKLWSYRPPQDKMSRSLSPIRRRAGRVERETACTAPSPASTSDPTTNPAETPKPHRAQRKIRQTAGKEAEMPAEKHPKTRRTSQARVPWAVSGSLGRRQRTETPARDPSSTSQSPSSHRTLATTASAESPTAPETTGELMEKTLHPPLKAPAEPCELYCALIRFTLINVSSVNNSSVCIIFKKSIMNQLFFFSKQ